jgi:putative transcriptional regulator
MQYIYCILQYLTYICRVGNLKLKLARIEKGLSQEELADLCEVTRQTIGLIEKGKYNPTLNLCIKIAQVLDKTLNDLFWDEEEN